MASRGRHAYDNLVQRSGTLLSASSTETANPVRWLRDQLPSKAWRSKTGWTIVAGFNDKIDFNRGGVKVATLTAGTYATGALLAAAIVTALEAADATPVWACTYDTSAKKFTLSSDLAFVLLFSSGANVATSVHLDLGHATADTASATSHVGANVAYQSRHYIKADLGSAMAASFGAVIRHNLLTGGTVTLQGNASDAWTSPTVNQALTGDADIRLAYFASSSQRYWRLLINDVANPLGFAQVGILFAGPYVAPSVTYSIDFQRSRVEHSTVTRSDHGAPFQDAKPGAREYTLSWSEVGEADRDLLEALRDAAPPGTCFFFAFNPTDEPTDVVYGYIVDRMTLNLTGGLYWDVAFTLVEALD